MMGTEGAGRDIWGTRGEEEKVEEAGAEGTMVEGGKDDPVAGIVPIVGGRLVPSFSSRSSPMADTRGLPLPLPFFLGPRTPLGLEPGPGCVFGVLLAKSTSSMVESRSSSSDCASARRGLLGLGE